MRIDLFGSTDTTELGKGGSRIAPSAQEASSLPEDKATFSSGDVSFASLVSQTMATSVDRAAKVESLKQAVAAGTYTLDPQGIATAMTNEWQ